MRLQEDDGDIDRFMDGGASSDANYRRGYRDGLAATAAPLTEAQRARVERDYITRSECAQLAAEAVKGALGDAHRDCPPEAHIQSPEKQGHPCHDPTRDRHFQDPEGSECHDPECRRP